MTINDYLSQSSVTVAELAEHLGVTQSAIYVWKVKGCSPRRHDVSDKLTELGIEHKIPVRMIYEFSKGGEIIITGTIKECSKHFNLDVQRLREYCVPSRIKRNKGNMTVGRRVE